MDENIKDNIETIEETIENKEVVKEETIEEEIKKEVEKAAEKQFVDPLEAFDKEFKQPSQEFPENSKTIDNEPKEELNPTSENEPITKDALKRKAGKGIFLTIDGLMVMGAGLLADESTSNFKLDKETRTEIEEGFIELSDAYGWEQGLPPWIPLTVLIATAYGTMFYNAYGIRKEKTAKKKKIINQKKVIKQQERKQINTANNTVFSEISEQKTKLNLSDFDVKTDFEIPKKKGRGRLTLQEQKTFDTFKAMKEELERVKENQKILIES